MSTTIFDITETVVIGLEVRVAGVLTNPASTPTVTVWNPGGVKKVDAVAITPGDTGCYSYDFNAAADATEGTWKILVNVVDGSRITKIKAFFVMEEI